MNILNSSEFVVLNKLIYLKFIHQNVDINIVLTLFYSKWQRDILIFLTNHVFHLKTFNNSNSMHSNSMHSNFMHVNYVLMF